MAKSSASRIQTSGASAISDGGGSGQINGVHEVSFKPAKGGLVSETRIRRKIGRGSQYDLGSETQSAIHPTIKHAIKHLTDTLGAAFGGEKGDED